MCLDPPLSRSRGTDKRFLRERRGKLNAATIPREISAVSIFPLPPLPLLSAPQGRLGIQKISFSADEYGIVLSHEIGPSKRCWRSRKESVSERNHLHSLERVYSGVPGEANFELLSGIPGYTVPMILGAWLGWLSGNRENRYVSGGCSGERQELGADR